MLVLSRQKDELIVLDFSKTTDADIEALRSGKVLIEVCTVDIRGDKVRHGISAPKSVAVHRKEILDAIRREAREELLAEQAKAAEEKK